MRLAWLTDIHLDYVNEDKALSFVETVRAAEPDVVLIGGDIGQAPSVKGYLRLMAEMLRVPIYFVLGNHDFHDGSIAQVRADITALCEDSLYLHYLSVMDAVELTPNIALVGHDGWADLQFGNFATSSVWMLDYVRTEELKGRKKIDLLPIMTEYAAEAAEHIQGVIVPALENYPRVLVLTHVPPFREATWHEGNISNDEFLPHFSSKVMGDVLRYAAAQYPQRQITVLCGHTHGEGTARIAPNLVCFTARAEYEFPEIYKIYELS